MKKSELIFNTLSLPFDALALVLAGVSSFYLRQNSSVISKPIIYQLQIHELLMVSVKILPVLIIIFALLGLYNLKGTRKFISEFGKVVVGNSLGLLIIMLLFFFDQTIFPSRFIILATWILGIIYVIIGRAILKTLQLFLFKNGFGLHRLIVVSQAGDESQILQKILENKSLGYQVVANLPYTEKIFETLETLYQNKKIDEILQTNSSLDSQQNLKLVEFARSKGLEFSFVPNLFEVQRNAIETRDFQGLPVISLKNSPLDGWGRVAKRIFDIIVSLTCLIICSPLFIIIAIAVRLDSPGKAIYSAPRGGKNKDFKFYKFRSMFYHLSVGEKFGGKQAEEVRKQLWHKNDRGGESGPFLKIKNDPRVTKVGRFLRKTKLDEIPQFWNVLKGDMSMVGPRAHVLDEVDRYRNRYRRMFSVKPGVFGLSQIAQFNWQDLPFEEEIRLNTFYIENWSLWLDIKILAKTFWLLFFSKKSNENY
jgi:exopolysaccharide biosynthesis polyprenyl glycosylphosphotransferase